MSSNEYILLEDEFGAHNYKPLDVVIERGDGIWVWDVTAKNTWTACPPIPPSTKGTATHAS